MTIKDLAAQTGYSVGTVSRVLNNQPHVSQQARDRIQRAVQESGFRLNTNAQQLKQARSTSILVIAKGRTNELFSDLVEFLHIKAARHYPLLVDYIDESENEVRRAIQLCMEKKPGGILFLGGNRRHFLADFQKISLPCVLVTNSAEGLPFRNLSSVSSDNALAAQMAISHLVELGHRKIVVIGGTRHDSDTAAQRYEGCLKAFREHDIDFDEERDYEPARFSFTDGYRAARTLLERSGDFTALFAMSDVMAIGAIRALQDAGKRVPEDISVIGLDGLALGQYTVPRLSTVTQAVEELADQSLELLHSNLDGRNPTHVTVPVTLTKKESTKARSK